MLARWLWFIFLTSSLSNASVTPQWEIRFPSDFMWGAATAAFQIEGAYAQDGRGLSIWDTFCMNASKCSGENATIADDHYNRVPEDVQLIDDLGVGYYRMSLSWSRLFPTGSGATNKPGIDHYNMEIDTLKKSGIIPFVTLYHWDLPQGLEDNGGWLNSSTVDAFVEYANLTFSLYGDRVKWWSTFNEPYVVSFLGYGTGEFAPGRCSNRSICDAGDSVTEPYIVAHNLLLAHARAVDLYRTVYQKQQNGKIGIVINSDWAEPLNETSPEDIAASERWLEFTCGWFADPVYFGDYPASMKASVGSRLPAFSEDEKALLKHSTDFFALNHYTSVYTTVGNSDGAPGWPYDVNITTTRERNGVLIGPVADSSWLYVVPWGLRKLLSWVNTRYTPRGIIITENGVDAPGESKLPVAEAVNDTFRINYLAEYLTAVSESIYTDGVIVNGYYVWSLLDNFEWRDGYSKRFGIYYVDYSTNLTRIAKQSSLFYTKVASYNQTSRMIWIYSIIGVILILGVVVGVMIWHFKGRKQKSYSALHSSSD